jgi:signal transduction histidine kinase
MKSFTARLTWRFALLVTGTMAVVLVLGGWLLSRQTIRALDLTHEAEGRELADLLDATAGQPARVIKERIERDADSDDALYFLQIDDDRGAVIFRSTNLGATILPRVADVPVHTDINLPTLGALRLSIFRHGSWRILVASFLAPTERIMSVYLEVSSLLLLIAALASIGLGYGFSRMTLRPIHAIESAARRIGAGHLDERISAPPGHAELSALAVVLNQTFDRLQESFEQISRFTADASHELKTPLALIRLNAEKLRQRAGLDAESTGSLDELMEEIAHLQQVIDRLLFLARSGSGAMVADLRPVQTADFLTEFAHDATVLAEDRDIRFVLGRNEAGSVRVEPSLLRQLLLNLISNAVAVSPTSGTVTLDAHFADDHWRLTVSDEGPGLPPEQLEHIFQRFVRYPAEPGQERPGHGLGLAISRSIAKLHQGSIRAENRTDRTGLKVILEVPVQSA